MRLPPPLDATGRTRPLEYLAWGLGLFLLKVVLDALVVHACFGLSLDTRIYVSPLRPVAMAVERPDVLVVLLALSLPFAWCGLALTIRRLRDAALPLWLAVLFVMPGINLLLFVLLVVVATRDASAVPDAGRPLARALFVPVALLLACSFAAVAVWLSVNLFASYGLGVFVGIPFLTGYIAAAVANQGRERGLGVSAGIGAIAVLCTSGVFLLIGIEGMICLLMAAPLALPLGALGGFVAGAVYRSLREAAGPAARRALWIMPLLLPGLLGVERATDPPPPLRAVTTAVEVDAPPAVVWRHVLAFPPLPKPDDWMFRAGIAYPISARIDGRGPGAIRHCVFSTGPFVEPIEVWDEPRLLRFAVTSCPDPMREWSPWAIHPPHLDGFLVSRRGEFALQELPGGRTRLAGTTWYEHGLWPEAYWRWWGDAVIHRIHERVLEHIAGLAGKDARRADGP